MKKVLFYLLFALLSAGCDDDGGGRIWDFTNYDVVIFVQSSEGDNLFDPATEGNILDNEITIEYDGKTYRMNEPTTRATMAYWYGLRIGNYYGYSGDDGTPALMFGEFRTETDGYHGETFTIDWGDGTTSKVTFDLYLTWAWSRDKGYDVPTTHRKIDVDGKWNSDYTLAAVITK